MSVSLERLKQAVNRLQERAENTEINRKLGKTISDKDARPFTDIFVDTNILHRITQSKNQLIYGRRGTGKTILLGRLYEYYRDSFDKEKILPIFLDGRIISDNANIADANPGISILICYRTFIESIITGIEDFMSDSITIGIFGKIWPGNKNKQKINRVTELLSGLRTLLHGEPTVGTGIVTTERLDKTSKNKQKNYAAHLGISSTNENTPQLTTDLKLGLSNVSSQNVDESLKIIYNGFTALRYDKITEYLDTIITELELDSIAILFDEWSAIKLEHQPFFAQMIRTTLIPEKMGNRKIFVKFACIPLLTNLSVVRDNNQPIGFPIGEEIFVEVDLDVIYNAYADPENNAYFLLSILQKHLAYDIHEFKEIELKDFYRLFRKDIFQDDRCIAELVLASGGVPRDFLRIFTRTFQVSPDRLPLNAQNLRMASHLFFQDEKRILLNNRKDVVEMFDSIYDNVCLSSGTYIFFISRNNSQNKILRELWHHRLIHLLFKGLVAFAAGKPSIYDVYAIDYGCYVLMRDSENGEEFVLKMQTLGKYIKSWFKSSSELGVIWNPQIDRETRYRFNRLFETETRIINAKEMAEIKNDCSKLVADNFMNKLNAN